MEILETHMNMAPLSGNLARKIAKIDSLLSQLAARQINPLRVLAASVAAYDRRHRQKEKTKTST